MTNALAHSEFMLWDKNSDEWEFYAQAARLVATTLLPAETVLQQAQQGVNELKKQFEAQMNALYAELSEYVKSLFDEGLTWSSSDHAAAAADDSEEETDDEQGGVQSQEEEEEEGEEGEETVLENEVSKKNHSQTRDEEEKRRKKKEIRHHHNSPTSTSTRRRKEGSEKQEKKRKRNLQKKEPGRSGKQQTALQEMLDIVNNDDGVGIHVVGAESDPTKLTKTCRSKKAGRSLHRRPTTPAERQFLKLGFAWFAVLAANTGAEADEAGGPGPAEASSSSASAAPKSPQKPPLLSLTNSNTRLSSSELSHEEVSSYPMLPKKSLPMPMPDDHPLSTARAASDCCVNVFHLLRHAGLFDGVPPGHDSDDESLRLESLDDEGGRSSSSSSTINRNNNFFQGFLQKELLQKMASLSDALTLRTKRQAHIYDFHHGRLGKEARTTARPEAPVNKKEEGVLDDRSIQKLWAEVCGGRPGLSLDPEEKGKSHSRTRRPPTGVVEDSRGDAEDLLKGLLEIDYETLGGAARSLDIVTGGTIQTKSSRNKEEKQGARRNAEQPVFDKERGPELLPLFTNTRRLRRAQSAAFQRRLTASQFSRFVVQKLQYVDRVLVPQLALPRSSRDTAKCNNGSSNSIGSVSSAKQQKRLKKKLRTRLQGLQKDLVQKHEARLARVRDSHLTFPARKEMLIKSFEFVPPPPMKKVPTF